MTLLSAALSALLAGGAWASSPTVPLSAFKDLRIGGSLALNWRNVAPREPGFEQQIQNEVFLSDMYFALGGSFQELLPVFFEFQIPTGQRGRLLLNQFYIDYPAGDQWRLQAGKFLVPFGRFNELYRADEFLPATRPLTHASPDSLDLVVRLNSPRPPLTAGYTDVGVRVTHYPSSPLAFVPVEVDFYIVNGLGEFENRQRTFPSPGNLNIPPVPQQGTSLDFGHENNNLADNNNNKVPGARVVFALGDLRLPWPIPGHRTLRGANLALSAMHGRYDLETELDYSVLGIETSFNYGDLRLTVEGVWSEVDFRTLTLNSNRSVTLPANTRNIPIDAEIHRGLYVQTVLPLLRDPRWGKKTLGVLGWDFLERRGPHMEFSTNNVASVGNLPIPAKLDRNQRITTKILKYSAAVNHRLNENVWIKAEFAYWDIFVPNIGGTPQTDVWQSILTAVVGF